MKRSALALMAALLLALAACGKTGPAETTTEAESDTWPVTTTEAETTTTAPTTTAPETSVFTVVTEAETSAVEITTTTRFVPAGLRVGQRAPDFTLQLPGGGSVTLSTLRGRPVVLNFFATWCGPCQEEMPELQAIFEEYRGRAYVLGVSSGETADVVNDFLARTDYTYPMAYDPSGVVSDAYDVQYIPQTWVLDAEGVIVEYIPSGTNAQRLREALELR